MHVAHILSQSAVHLDGTKISSLDPQTQHSRLGASAERAIPCDRTAASPFCTEVRGGLRTGLGAPARRAAASRGGGGAILWCRKASIADVKDAERGTGLGCVDDGPAVARCAVSAPDNRMAAVAAADSDCDERRVIGGGPGRWVTGSLGAAIEAVRAGDVSHGPRSAFEPVSCWRARCTCIADTRDMTKPLLRPDGAAVVGTSSLALRRGPSLACMRTESLLGPVVSRADCCALVVSRAGAPVAPVGQLTVSGVGGGRLAASWAKDGPVPAPGSGRGVSCSGAREETWLWCGDRENRGGRHG